MNIEALAPRSDFPLLAADPKLHYLDSAATTQKPRSVLDAIIGYYERDNANPHRGAYSLSAAATEAYQTARDSIARFHLGAADPDTADLPAARHHRVAESHGGRMGRRKRVKKGDRVVVTRLEHHANFVPWQQLALESGAEFRICELTEEGEVDLEKLSALVTANTKVVAFGHVSNALGTVNPVGDIAAIAHRAGALAVCDGAQGAPHASVNFHSLGVDAYAFSGHKMLGPMGIGGVIVKREILEAMPPYQMGGDMIALVGDAATTWNVLPHKFEAGTPNVEGAVGLAAGVAYLEALGMNRVHAHEQALVKYAMERLGSIDDVAILGPPAERRGGVVSFTLRDVHPHDLSQLLDAEGIAVRAGHHCAQPLMRSLGVNATTRASVYVYNDSSDIDALASAVSRVKERFGAAV